MIFHRHEKGPRTYKRSKKSPIDCIFGSVSLIATRVRCLPFSRLCSDHRVLWIDIPTDFLLGYNPSALSKFIARKLKLNDPRVVDKTLENNLCKFKEQYLFTRMNHIHSQAVFSLPDDLISVYEKIDG